MFKKKKCPNCGSKINEKYSYCPICGKPIKSDNDSEDWGMLGKNDLFEDMEIKLPFGFNALFNSLVKSLDKQFREIDKEIGKQSINPEKISQNKINQERMIQGKIPRNSLIKSGGIKINISSSNGKEPRIVVQSFGDVPEFNQQEKQIKKQFLAPQTQLKAEKFSEEKAKKLSVLPRKEPTTSIRRLSNKLVYEINLPGVKSLDDISIIQLENSIEIKALAKDTAYFKLIPISMIIKNQKLTNGKLILEFASE